MRFTLLITAAVCTILIGCSGTGVNSPLSPDVTERATNQSTSHHLWGLWQVTADPESGTLNFTEMRTASMHLNAVPLLEPPAGVKLKVSNLKFAGSICDVDVTLVHPYPGLSQYTGFDVAGILISRGTVSGFHDPDLLMAGSGDTRLLNPDGLTRWWNPAEFAVTGPPIFRYRDGMLGTKNETAGFNCTLNGYKLFGDEIDVNENILDLDPSTRIPFSAGYINTRHYKIDFSGGIVFNYAVDANWELPQGSPPFTPDEFAPEANRPEAWAVSITEIENTLYNDGTNSGGNLLLEIDVWDHFNAGQNMLWVDSPGNFDFTAAGIPSGGGDGFSTYVVDIVDTSPAENSIDILIGIESDKIGYHNLLSGKPVTGYFTYTAQVENSNLYPPVAIMVATTPTDIDNCDSVSFDASSSTGSPPLTFEWDFNGDAVYGGPEDDYTGDVTTPTHQFKGIGTYNVTVKVSNGVGWDISDVVVVNVGLNADGIYVDGDYTGGGSDGTLFKPYTKIQDAMAVATSGTKIHVDYMDSGSGIYDTAGLTLKSGVELLGDNWNGCDQDKPKVSCATSGRVLFGQNVSNVWIEGFEIIVPAGPSFSDFVDYPTLAGIHLRDSNANGGGGSTNNNTIRRCLFTGSVTISAGYLGVYLEGAVNTLIELCEFGPLNGISSPNFWIVQCVMQHRSDGSIIRKNWIHDLFANVSTNSGEIRVFHILWSDDVQVTNNLIHDLDAQNGYCNISSIYINGQPGTVTSKNPIVANNTIDDIESNGWGIINCILFSNTTDGDCIPNAKVYNNIVSNTIGPASSRAFQHVAAPTPAPNANFCNAYNTAWLASGGAEGYLGFAKGTGSYGNWTNPQNPAYISAPSNYDLTTSSTSQYGDPSIVDWDDTGSPSGNPSDYNINTRSRMGAFGGPDGNWWPLE